MKRIIAIGASNSRNSINQQFAWWAAGQLKNVEVELLDLNDFEMPLYSIDRERENGVHPLAQAFKEHIRNADAIVLSLAEHNGNYTAAFKNIVDWVSRIEKTVWTNKPMLLLSTAPGPRGGLSVLQTAVRGFPYLGAKVVGHFALPSFGQNFESNTGIIEEGLNQNFQTELQKLSLTLQDHPDTKQEALV